MIGVYDYRGIYLIGVYIFNRVAYLHNSRSSRASHDHCSDVVT